MLRVVILKPSKYGINGYVERFRRGFMPNSTVPYVRSMTPDSSTALGWRPTRSTNTSKRTSVTWTLLRNPGAADAAGAGRRPDPSVPPSPGPGGICSSERRRHGVIGGPHAMTCDTSMLHGRGVSFALAEAELVWRQILRDAIRGELRPVYGARPAMGRNFRRRW